MCDNNFFEQDDNTEHLSLRTYNEDGKIINEWDEEKGWFEDGTEQNEYGYWIMNRIYHPYTEDQLAEIQNEKEKKSLLESRQKMTFEEAVMVFLNEQLNTVNISDQLSLRMMQFYPTFNDIIGRIVKIGFKFVYEDKLYKTIQPDLLIQQHYPPENGNESLYACIDLEHVGKIYDPIPYNGNMELEKGKYYVQDDVLYFCITSSGQPVYHRLSDILDLYVKRVVD